MNDKLYRVRILDRPRGSAPAGAKKAPPKLGAKKRTGAASGNDVVSPMHGAVIEINVAEGDAIAEGQVVAVVEAMKMMNELRAHRAGIAATVHVKPGETVEAGAPIVSIS